MIDLIKAATLTNDTELQKQAEAALLNRRQENPEDFFIQNAKILQSPEVLPAIRQAAGTLLTVSLKTKSNDTYLWYALSSPNRSAFKDMVLNTMIDHQKIIRRAAANIVAAICCIEIPRNQWPGIAQKITSNISSEDLRVKEVSILTIGFMCEQLKQFNFFFEEHLQETILTGILLGVKDSHPYIAETAFKALRQGMPSLSTIMKNVQYRQYLISQVAEALNSKNFVELALQCLSEFIRCYYSLIQQQYVEGLVKYIDPILTDHSEEVNCVQAMQFWAQFAKEQKNIESNPNLTKYITGPIGDRLVEVLLQNLCLVEVQEEEGNGISQGAASALQAIFESDSGEYQKKILLFTQNTIHHENWKFRQASIRAFSLLLIGLPPERSQALVNSSLLELVALVGDSKQYVQLSAVRSLSMISEQVPSVILHHQSFLQILQLIVKMVKGGQAFLKYVCRIIDNLSSSQKGHNFVGPHVSDLIKVFLDQCLLPNRSIASINYCLNVIINLIKCSANIQICNFYIDFVKTHYPDLHNLQPQRRDIFYSGFFTIAQVCLITIRKANGSITMDQLSSLYNLVVEHYKRINDVEGDGYYLVSALAYFIPNDRRLIDDFWKYIEYGLKKLNQQEIFKSTISCICDFATTYREQISDKIDPVITEILDLYQKNLITRQLKLDVLMCIGELFLQCGDFCVKHLKRVMDLLLISCEGVLVIPDLNYAEILQESIIETFMCIYHGIGCQQGVQMLPGFIPFILQFIRLTTENKRHPKLEYVKESLMLLADISSICPGQTGKMIKAGFINDRALTLMKFNKDGHLSQTISYVKQQFRTTF